MEPRGSSAASGLRTVVWASLLCLLSLGKEPHTFLRFLTAKVKTKEISLNFWSELSDNQNAAVPRC